MKIKTQLILISLTLQLWPVLAALGPGPLHGPGGHHDHHHPLLPHQLPRVREGAGQRALEDTNIFCVKKYFCLISITDPPETSLTAAHVLTCMEMNAFLCLYPST